ncbi:Nif3-like dinuclear metal center hexameric protein [Xylocopilactobacillus apicola]|uniref:GTP cyclohydrolase 1 type 2 homolog n=1 Tax=Xylocopilactobacillus apicola TaxID=2932184 RepID=A0AAU9DFB7_9LACO|nr:Nif3-like dinuclear metal center hexameric protein [Xylocopilactobacillus apicola]BDR58620.1 GTP cyclohydrolase 1 type 2 [Xylocopilactobacillus apicola]
MKNDLLESVMEFLENLYPLSDAMTWDHVGLQIGDPKQKVQKIITTLDVTPNLVDYAIKNNFDTIVSHHPLLFHPIQVLDLSDARNQMYQKIINHQINVYSMHTNFDVGKNGMNDWLAELIGLKNIEGICPVKTTSGTLLMGRMGDTTLEIEAIIEIFKHELGLKMIKLLDNGKSFKKIGILGGAGAEFIEPAFKSGVDLFITGDVKYHDFLDAQIANYAVLDVGHVAEKIFARQMANLLQENFDFTIEANTLDEMEIPGLENK